MHRVELKEEVESKINSWFFKFLMHRVELKDFMLSHPMDLNLCS